MTPEELAADPNPRGSVVRDACSNEIASWEQRFIENIEASIAQRRVLYDKAPARLAALGGQPGLFTASG